MIFCAARPTLLMTRLYTLCPTTHLCTQDFSQVHKNCAATVYITKTNDLMPSLAQHTKIAHAKPQLELTYHGKALDLCINPHDDNPVSSPKCRILRFPHIKNHYISAQEPFHLKPRAFVVSHPCCVTYCVILCLI